MDNKYNENKLSEWREQLSFGQRTNRGKFINISSGNIFANSLKDGHIIQRPLETFYPE